MINRLQEEEGADGRPRFVARTAVSLACLLLSSALVCWVAANWQQASHFQKLLGAQLLLTLLVLAGMALSRRQLRGAERNRNFAFSTHVVGLAGVAAGALFALIGQIYQTGADPWQLFMLWAVLLLPWVVSQHTVFITLLFALVLNIAAALYLDFRLDGFWWGAEGWTTVALLLALLNIVLLALYERFITVLEDPWRIGPRALASAIAGWLVAAGFAVIDSHTGPLGVSLIGWAVLALMYWVYTRLRHDLAIVSLAALAAFVLLVMPLVYWAGSEGGLFLVVIVLLIAMAVGLRKLGQLLRAKAVMSDPWYVSAFRLVAMGITAVLLLVLVLLTLEIEFEHLWTVGLVLCIAGVAAFRAGGSEVLRELGLTLATTGLLLSGGSFFYMHEEGSQVAVYALSALGAAMYVLAGNAAFRFIAAFFTLALVTVMTWPHDSWVQILDSHHSDPSAPFEVSLRMWWFSLAGVLTLLWGRGEHAGRRWRPLAWALVFMAQLTVWQVPATSIEAFSFAWRNYPSAVLIWLGCAAMPVAALAAVLWRTPALPAALRVGAPMALAVAALGWMGAPGVSLALLWLVVGYAMGHRTLVGFAVLALLTYLARFYFQLDSTLLHKSFLLGVTGAWLLCSFVAVRLLVRRQGKTTSAAADTDRGNLQLQDRPSTRRAHRWRQGGLLVGLLIILAVANTGIYEREQLLSSGERVVLELAPVDPRSLMQGDYMRLHFAVADQAARLLRELPKDETEAIESQRSGMLQLRPDVQGVHHLVSVLAASAKETVQLGEQDVLLEFHLRGSAVHVVTDAWFFPEGEALHFEQARYGEFRVRQGVGLLTGLLDNQLKPLTRD